MSIRLSRWPLPAVLCLLGWIAAAAAEDLITITVRVPAADLQGRDFDEGPAEFAISPDDVPQDRRIDLASLEVRAWDALAKKLIGETLPSRWYDAALPDDFPIVDGNVSGTEGKKFPWMTRRRWGEFFPVIGDGKAGKIAWLHRQTKQEGAEYQISYRLLPAGKKPAEMPRRGFIGDGSPRCAPLGEWTTGMVHSRLAVADWNHDGLDDLIVGGMIGNIVWYPNQGTKTEPKFPVAHLVFQADGKPLDTGWGAVPVVVDWDNDGNRDLLVGAERNRILFYRDEGDGNEPKLVNHGFVELDGKPLELPVAPVPHAPEKVFYIDYYPVLDVVDWEGNGQRDLLAGGYITGRIFRYEETGRTSDGVPILAARGPLEADGKPLNVGDWAAAPTTADFDGDGDLDLVSGNMEVAKEGGGDPPPSEFLVYFENVGTRTEPKLTRREFPRQGKFPHATLGSPRAVDFNGDGLLDLAVSSNLNIFLFPNIGTKSEPRFDVTAAPLPAVWGAYPLPTTGLQFLDYNGDGKRDLLSILSVYVQTEPGKYQRTGLLARDCKIDHPQPHGDPWTFTQLADLNGDDRLDLLYGTHEGHVWLHAAGEAQGQYDQTGFKLLLTNGEPVHVGPKPGQDVKDFIILQGSRTTFTVADFDGDGRLDLVVGDTKGVARYFQNAGTKAEPVFELAHEFESLGIRMVPFAADWNHDGRMDVVGSAASGKVVAWINQGDGKFAPVEPIDFPAVPYSPSVSVIDWNDDGDDDLIIGTAYGFFCWFERSFLERGAFAAERVK